MLPQNVSSLLACHADTGFVGLRSSYLPTARAQSYLWHISLAYLDPFSTLLNICIYETSKMGDNRMR